MDSQIWMTWCTESQSMPTSERLLCPQVEKGKQDKARELECPGKGDVDGVEFSYRGLVLIKYRERPWTPR